MNKKVRNMILSYEVDIVRFIAKEFTERAVTIEGITKKGSSMFIQYLYEPRLLNVQINGKSVVYKHV